MESGFLTTNVISHFSQHWREVGHSISVMSLTHELFARKTKRPGLSLSPGTSVDQPSPKCCSRTTVDWGALNGKWLIRAKDWHQSGNGWKNSRKSKTPPSLARLPEKAGHPVSLADGVNFVRKTKRPKTQFESGTSVDQPS